VKVWAGDRTFERTLKRRKNAPRRLCPVCRGNTGYEEVNERGLMPPGTDGCGADDPRPLAHAPADEDEPPF